jgi:hypothetical protein
MYGSKILNRIKLDYFLKFIVHELNSEMVKSEMTLLTGREKSDGDVAVGWKLHHAAKTVVDEMERENWYDVGKNKIQPARPLKPTLASDHDQYISQPLFDFIN